MRKFFWQRLALICLLVGRLVIGELGHAMPASHAMDMGSSHHQMAAPSLDPVACPEHESGRSQTPSSHQGGDAPMSGHAGSSDSAVEQETDEQGQGTQDCCQSGDCECPCLHVPCAALDALVLNPVATTLLRTPHGAGGWVSQRPSRLFRPPA